MTDDRLPTALYIDAHLKRLTLEGVPYYIVNKGAYAAGTIMLKLSAPPNGCRVLQQQRDLNGVMGWMALFKGETVPDAKADEHIRKAVSRDPDLWVIEIEGRGTENPFEGKIF
jgi:hypothetical protein